MHLFEVIEEYLYQDTQVAKIATFFKQRINTFTFKGRPSILASGGSIGGAERDFDKNIFGQVPELPYSFMHEGVAFLRPDLTFFQWYLLWLLRAKE